MVRPFLSLVVAAVASVLGLVLVWVGAGGYAVSVGAMRPQLDVVGLGAALVGLLFLGVVGLSLAIHWVGALIVGSVHALLGLLALAVPLGNSLGDGIFSPVFQITRMLYRVNSPLGDGAMIFYFSGIAFAVGVFLAAAALGVRTRRLAGPSSATAIVVSSVLGGVTLILASGVVIVAGGDFAQSILRILRYDGVLAAIAVGGGVLAGVAGILLRWSSLGIAVAGALVTVIGLVLFVGVLPFSLPRAVWFPAMYGVIAVAGVTFLGSAIGGAVRQRAEVPAAPAAL